MSNSYEAKLPLNVMISKDNNKVLFAEANTDFINVLLSFLALPLGKLRKNSISLGSIDTLYKSLSDMDAWHFCVPGAKQMLLNPRSRLSDRCRKLKIDVTHSPPNVYYVCDGHLCHQVGRANVSVYSGIARCDCGRWLDREKPVNEESLCGCGDFITKPDSFVVTDDLRVMPVVTGLFQTLGDLGISHTPGAEMKTLSFGIDEIRKFLKLCLCSSTPLSDMVVKKVATTRLTAVKVEPGITLDHIPKEKFHSREMYLKVFLQKSTNKFLYAEATYEFVEMLFSFLTLPLGGVELLLGGNTCFKSIVNVYRSVANDIDDECFTTPETKTSLVDPKLPYGCKSDNQPFLLLGDEDILFQELYYKTKNLLDFSIGDIAFHENQGERCYKVSSFKWSEEVYLKKHSRYIVTEGLSVSPGLSRSFLILNDLGIPFSDVKETELRIGLEEALSILKASLISETPLTDALVKPMLDKLPKLERKWKQEL